MEFAATEEQRNTRVMSARGERILVIGNRSPLLEGVADLLQLSGYNVEMSSNWVETSYALNGNPPNLAVVELSSFASDGHRLSEQIHTTPRWAEVPILFVSFSGDDRIRELQRWSSKSQDPRLQFYAHTVLSMDGLLEKVGACLAEH